MNTQTTLSVLRPGNKHQCFRFSNPFTDAALHSVYKFIAFFVLALLLSPVHHSFAQDKPKEDIDEWEEVLKLRNKFLNGNYGSQHMLGIFDGRFIGPNNKMDYGVRSFTTAYDYLILGNSLLSLMVNLDYRADNIKFLSINKIPDGKTYKLGCIWFYTIGGDKFWVDSVFSTKLNKMVPADDPRYVKSSRLKIDSTHVNVDLAGVVRKNKNGREITYDTLLLPPIDGTGSWKDANNYDLAYEWMEYIFNTYKDTFDISKRQFSRHTPDEVKNVILKRYNSEKYLDQHQLSEFDLDITLKDQMGANVTDMINQPNGKILRSGDYDYFRFFGDVYYKPANLKAEKSNPVWHCAYQYDKDVEKNSKGLIDFVILGYGSKDYIMPTVIPRNLPAFTQFEGVIIYQKGAEREGYSSNDDIWVNTLNGRMIDRYFFEFPHEKGLLPLNDDGTVDRIYKIYAWKDKKPYWAYIYCGKHAGVRGGKPGKSLVDQVDDFRQQYQSFDYWYFISSIDYQEDIKARLPAFSKDLYDFAHNITGSGGKTVPRVQIPIEYKDPRNPKRTIKETKTLTFFRDGTATMDPDGLIIPWKIEEMTDERLRKHYQVKLNILGKEMYIQDLEAYLINNQFSSADVSKFNKKYLKERESYVEIPDSTERTTEIYKKQAYDLTITDDARSLLERVMQDIKAQEYQLPELTKNVEWQKTNKVEHLEKRLQEMDERDDTKSGIYQKIKEEYEKEVAKLEKMEEDLHKLEYECVQLRQKEVLFREYYIRNLENTLLNINEKRNFIYQQVSILEKNMQVLEDEGKTDTEAYLQMKQSLRNKDGEILEVEAREKIYLKLLAEQKSIKEQGMK